MLDWNAEVASATGFKHAPVSSPTVAPVHGQGWRRAFARGALTGVTPEQPVTVAACSCLRDSGYSGVARSTRDAPSARAAGPVCRCAGAGWCRVTPLEDTGIVRWLVTGIHARILLDHLVDVAPVDLEQTSCGVPVPLHLAKRFGQHAEPHESLGFD